ncbi:MAG: hypothetical protein J6A79_03515 [Clostridia bacterium]|nr:hypothetical protein [Clostridia bacterium]
MEKVKKYLKKDEVFQENGEVYPSVFEAFPAQRRKGRNSKKPLFLGFSEDSALPLTTIQLFILRRNAIRGPRGPQFCEFARETRRRSMGSKAVEI